MHHPCVVKNKFVTQKENDEPQDIIFDILCVNRVIVTSKVQSYQFIVYYARHFSMVDEPREKTSR